MELILAGVFSFAMMHFLIVPLVAEIIQGKDKPRELGYDPHKTKQLEIELHGKDWWEVFGTICDCAACKPPVPPKGPGAVVPVIVEHPRPQSRIEHLYGWTYTRPLDVPDNAHVEIDARVFSSGHGFAIDARVFGFANALFSWVDQNSGRQMRLRVMAFRGEIALARYKTYPTTRNIDYNAALEYRPEVRRETHIQIKTSHAHKAWIEQQKFEEEVRRERDLLIDDNGRRHITSSTFIQTTKGYK